MTTKILSAWRHKATLFLAITILFALCFSLIPPYFDKSIDLFMQEWFVGADTYMRVLRVRDWWDGGIWYESFSLRSNWPQGETLHWTRPFDILLVILATPFAPFVGMHKALYYSGVLISPVLLLSTFWIMLWGLKPFLDHRGRIILVLLITFQPISHYYFVAARPDHHSLILFGFAAVLTLLARQAGSASNRFSAAAWAGGLSAFSIWVSIESLTIELFALLALGVLWFWRGDQKWLQALRHFAWTGAIVMVVAIVIERPPSEWFMAEEYDRLSAVHVTLLALIALGIEGLWRFRKFVQRSFMTRAGGAVMASLAAAVIMSLVFPDFFKGPFGAAMDPRLQTLWLNKIQEFQPLTKTDISTLLAAVMILGPILWVGVWGLYVCKSPDKSKQDVDQFIVLAIAVLLYLPLTLAQSRWGGYMAFAVSIGWALLLQHLLNARFGPIVGPKPGTPILRVPTFAFVAIGHIMIAGGLTIFEPIPDATRPARCQWADLAPYLNSSKFADGTPQTLLSFIHQGPQILYRTKHHVIGTPYHRNTRGILDSFTAFTAKNEAESKAVLTARNVDFVLVCVKSVEEKFFLTFEGDTLMRKITTNNIPKWLKPAPLPENLKEKFRLFHFEKESPPTGS